MMSNPIEFHTRSTQMCAVCYECDTVTRFKYEVNMELELVSHPSDVPAPSASHDISIRCNQCGNLMHLYRDGYSRLNAAIQNKLGADKMLIAKHSKPEYKVADISSKSLNKEFSYPITIFIASNEDENWSNIRDMIDRSAVSFAVDEGYNFIVTELDNHTIGSIMITFNPEKFIDHFKSKNINDDILQYMSRVYMDLLDYIAYVLE